MTYDKVNWDETTPLDAANLDQMDDGIKSIHDEANAEASQTLMARMATGTYGGNGFSTRTVSTPFTPRHVTIIAVDPSSSGGLIGWMSGDTNNVGTAVLRRDGDTRDQDSNFEIISGGFRVSGFQYMNEDGVVYHYTVFG